MNAPIALIRPVSAALAACELSFVARESIDLTRARAQHAAYAQALRDLGAEVLELPAEDAMPDAVFVEDVALVFDEVAVMTRPGAASRRAEGASVAPVLARWRALRQIEAPGTLDGGDVLRLGREVYVGLAARSNAEGIAQLRDLLAPFGYRVHAVRTRGCLHLKSAATALPDEGVLINADWLAEPEAFARYRRIAIDPAEPHAANCLRLGERVIHPACFPRTQERLRAAGVAVTPVDVSELQKAEGAVTCCSVIVGAGD
jgi:dimethylargininase